MNRRTVLGTAATLTTASLAGCVNAFREHFQGELSQPVVIEMVSEAERPYYVQIEARERETGRETYDQGFSVIPNERVQPPHLGGRDQQLRVIRFSDAHASSADVEQNGNEDGNPADGVIVDTVSITTDSKLVLIRIYDDDIELEVISDEPDAESQREELERGGHHGNQTLDENT